MYIVKYVYIPVVCAISFRNLSSCPKATAGFTIIYIRKGGVLCGMNGNVGIWRVRVVVAVERKKMRYHIL